MTNVIFCGVGGQGVILASKVLMETAMAEGFDVKESEVHGMAQRGGSVNCNVRFGDKVYSPLIPKNSTDYLVSFELLEAVRMLNLLSDDGRLLVNNLQIDPVPVQNGDMSYPENIASWLRQNVSQIEIVETKELLKQAGNKKVLNIVMLGKLSNYLDFSEDTWIASIKKCVKTQFVELNTNAFLLSRNENK
jgi:indolepyruvate ferredoxin oxidoreductase beta subunit